MANRLEKGAISLSAKTADSLTLSVNARYIPQFSLWRRILRQHDVPICLTVLQKAHNRQQKSQWLRFVPGRVCQN